MEGGCIQSGTLTREVCSDPAQGVLSGGRPSREPLHRESRAQTRRRAPALNPLLCDLHGLPRVQLDALCPRNGPASPPSDPVWLFPLRKPGPLQAGDAHPAGSPGTLGHRDDRSGPGTTAPVGSPPRLCRRRRRPAVRASEAELARAGWEGAAADRGPGLSIRLRERDPADWVRNDRARKTVARME